MRPITTMCVAALLAVTTRAQETRSSILFASGSSALDATAIAELAKLCERAAGQVPAMISISGHTDDIGSDAFNLDLSHRRAATVRGQLSRTCPALASTRIDWKGETNPLADNAEAPGRARNRRVDIKLTYATDAHAASIQLDAATTAPPVVGLYAHPKVEQLLPLADKPREMHRADAERGVDFTAADGTRIRITANAMVHADGRPVTGPVDISYRSFMEPYEIIASGIPMHVQTAEGTQHFETAGMYEVYASQNGQPVQLKSGERIQLERPMDASPDESYTGWELDPASGAWEAGGTITRPGSVVISSQVPMGRATPATVAYWNELRRLNAQERPDTTLFAARRTSGDYCHLTPCDTTAPRKVGWVQRRDRYEDVAGVPSIHVVGYKGLYEPENIIFAIRIDEDRQFPEWRRLPHDAAWKYIGPESKAIFKRLYGKRHAFQDIDLEMDPGNEEGTLRLKENGEWLELRVSAGLNRDTPGHVTRWDNAVKAYNRALAKHERNFNREITHRRTRYQREHVNVHLQAWKKARPDMNAEEAAISSDAWQAYAVPRQPPQPSDWNLNPAAREALANVRTTFGLDGFGIYNIDRIMKMASQQQVMASTIDAEGKPFPWVAAYAVLRTENSVITYWGNGTGEADNMLVSPGKMKSLFLVDREGNVATASTAPLNTGDARALLEVKRLDKSTDLETLRATASR